MLKRKTKGDVVFGIVNGLLLTILLIIISYPLIFVLSASISDPVEVLNGNVTLLPRGFSLAGFKRVFRDGSILVGYKNSIIYTVFGTILNVLLTATLAYPLSRKDFKGRGIITFLLTVTMFFGGGMVPTYLVYQSLRLVHNPMALIIRGAVSVWNVIIMRTAFEGLPYSLQEAAFIDGCSNIGVFLKIILPMSKPILAVMFLYYGVFHWNDFMGALIYINDEKWYPLQLILRNIMLQGEMESMSEGASEAIAQQQMLAESIKYAVIIVASVPLLVVYPFMQKYFVAGRMAGSVKG